MTKLKLNVSIYKMGKVYGVWMFFFNIIKYIFNYKLNLIVAFKNETHYIKEMLLGTWWKNKLKRMSFLKIRIQS